jgi:dethiobiotin synthetase
MRKYSTPPGWRFTVVSLMRTRVVFVTGTDTGVGKTLLTALLLCHLRERGIRAWALKPFCSGGRQDAELLHRLQDRELTLDEVNPFYFPEPVAPLVSARKHRREVSLDQVTRHIHSIVSRLSCVPHSRSGLVAESKGKSASQPRPVNDRFLIIEGSGGLLVPLGERYTVRDLIAHLACEVIVVSRNKLGTINHTLLTVQSLHSIRAGTSGRRSVVLMNSAAQDLSSRTNAAILAEILSPVPLVLIPFLGRNCDSVAALKRNVKKFQKTLAAVLV